MQKPTSTPETPAVAPAAKAAPDALPAPAPHGLIATQCLSKRYGRREVVHEVNVSVRAGEVVGLLGPNGAGKTTTFYMIVGLIPASSGKVFLDGRDITTLPMWQRSRLGLGYLPQEASIFRKLSVWENVMAIVETMDLPASARKAHTEAMLKDLGLLHLAKQPAYTLSGGERRRLEIARALATRPRFMLLDEPFSGVDPISVAEVQNIVRGLKKRGIGVLITDHNVRETLSIVDRAYLIHQGRVFVEGDAEVVINNPESRKFYLGQDFKM
jgi:lipopolysaccharide export system ATP-binding protein